MSDRDAIQMLAADNARLCERLIAAEKVIDEARKLANVGQRSALVKAIEAYDAGRPS